MTFIKDNLIKLNLFEIVTNSFTITTSKEVIAISLRATFIAVKAAIFIQIIIYFMGLQLILDSSSVTATIIT